MDSASTPLADYFWIAGIELASLKDPSPAQPTNQLENTISEDAEADESEASPQAGTARASARHSRHNSTNRLSKISNSDRLSFQALEELDVGTRSNRSSTTIRPSQLNGTGQAGGESTSAFGQDFDFDTALIKFAVEREKFLEDLTFSAGAKLESRPPMVNPRTERLKGADGEQSGRMSPLRSIRGSIRRKISFRELSSARKQPTVPRPGASLSPWTIVTTCFVRVTIC